MSSSQVSEPQISYLESSLIKNCSAVSTMDQMGIAEPVKDHWSHVVPFDFFCPAIDCLARETTLVAAHTAPAIHMLFHLDEYFQPAYRLSCSVPSARLTVRPHISNAPLILFFLSLYAPLSWPLPKLHGDHLAHTDLVLSNSLFAFAERFTSPHLFFSHIHTSNIASFVRIIHRGHRTPFLTTYPS